jgi:ABC-type amino acid transport substrate-binding protein
VSSGDGYAIAFSKESSNGDGKSLLKQFNEALKKLQGNGEVNKMMLKWLGR